MHTGEKCPQFHGGKKQTKPHKQNQKTLEPYLLVTTTVVTATDM